MDNETMIKELIDNYHGTIFGTEGAADIQKAKLGFQGIHNLEQSIRLLTYNYNSTIQGIM